MCVSNDNREIQVASAPIFFGKTRTARIGDLIQRFSTSNLASPFRSTIPLLDMTIRCPERLGAVLASCGIERPTSLHFEYCVDSSAGGNPSQTDLMVLAPHCALAIEAKWTEPRYECVSKRLVSRRSKRRDGDTTEAIAADRREQELAVRAWFELLARVATVPVTIESTANVVYQMIHRAASACAAGEQPSMLYLHFHAHDDPGAATFEDYHSDLEMLYAALGRPKALRFFVIEQPILPRDLFRTIEGLRKGALTTFQAVRAALLQGPLFEYGEYRVEQIG